MQSQIVVVGVCVAGRPDILSACLESLFRQAMPMDVAMHIAVADNEAGPRSRAVVDRSRRLSPFPLHYLQAPRAEPGFARNAVLAKALALAADWVAFIGAEEVADPLWIAGLMAPEYRDTPVLAGHRRRVFPDGALWAAPPRAPRHGEGEAIRMSDVRNARFSAVLAEGHRFAETMGAASDADADFFARLALDGAAARFTLKAETVETVPAGEATFHGHCRHSFGQERAAAHDIVERRGRGLAIARGALVIPARALAAGGLLLAATACGALSPAAFRRLALAGGQQAARGAGLAAGLLGRRRLPWHVGQRQAAPGVDDGHGRSAISRA